MKTKKNRDIEKKYTTGQMVAKLRRLADCLETGKQFRIQNAGERVNIPADAVSILSTKEKVAAKKWNFNSNEEESANVFRDDPNRQYPKN